MKKTCPVCGREFETNSSQKKYCSFACAGEAKYVRDLKYHRERRKRDPEFRDRLRRFSREYAEAHREKKERPYKQCIICGKDIPETRGFNAKTCSPECAKVNNSNRVKAWHREHPNGLTDVTRPKPKKAVEKESVKDMVINPECGVPCSECELDYCPYE